MGLEVKEFLRFTLANGTTVRTEADNPAKKFAEVKFTCDGPRCAKRNADKKPTTLEWSEAEAAEDPLVIPDAAWRIIIVGPPIGSDVRLLFCNQKCLADYFKTYVPPMSPREEEAQRKHNEAVEAQQKEDRAKKIHTD